MTATLVTLSTEIIHLSGISWQTYETLLKELSDRRLRLTYNRGNLEIMAPSPRPELSGAEPNKCFYIGSMGGALRLAFGRS